MNFFWFPGWGINPSWLAEQLSLLIDESQHRMQVAPALSDFTRQEWVANVKATAPKRWWCGWSMGTLCALNVAAEDTQCEGVILLAGTPKFQSDNDWTLGIEPKGLSDLSDRLSSAPEKSLKHFYRLIASGESHARYGLQSLIEGCLSWAGDRVEALQEELCYLTHTDLRRHISQIKKPIYFLLGQRDPLFLSLSVNKLQALSPWIKVMMLPEVGHAPFFDKAQVTLKLALKQCVEDQCVAKQPTEQPKQADGFENSEHYDQASVVQRTSARCLIQSAPKLLMNNGVRVLDLGCGTGFLTRQILSHYGKQLQLVAGLDVSSQMLKQAQSYADQDQRLVFLQGCMSQPEGMALHLGPWDVLLSNFAWHWLDCPIHGLLEWTKSLKPGGWLGLAFPVRGSLAQLQQAWRAVDSCQHTIQFPCWERFLKQISTINELKIKHCWQQSIYTEHETLSSIRQSLRLLGAPKSFEGARQGLVTVNMRRQVLEALEGYRTSRGRLQLAYQVGFLWCQKC